MSMTSLWMVFMLALVCCSTFSAGQTCTKRSRNGSPQVRMVTFPRRSTVKQGSDVTLVCVATPPLSRDVTRLFLPSAIKFFVNETLLRVPDCKARKRKIKICAVKLTNVTAKDSGTYSCQARNYRRCTYRRLKLRVVDRE